MRRDEQDTLTYAKSHLFFTNQAMNLPCMSDQTAQIVYRQRLKHSDPVKRDPIGSIHRYKPGKRGERANTRELEKYPDQKP